MKLIVLGFGFVGGLAVLTASPAAAAVTITCPPVVMVNYVGKNLPAGLTTWLFDRRAEFHSTGVLPTGQPTYVVCYYKVMQPLEAPPANPNFWLQQNFPANTTCSQRGADSWECLTALERQLRQSLPQPRLDRPTSPVPR
jgi:hypothetical protein